MTTKDTRGIYYLLHCIVAKLYSKSEYEFICSELSKIMSGKPVADKKEASDGR